MDKNLSIKNDSKSRRSFLKNISKLVGVTALTGAAANVFTPAKIKAETNGYDPFVGEIIKFGGNFAPRGFALCDGQLLAVSQNDALFSLLGTIYGGDGRTTFGLPDLRGRVPVHPGTGPGLPTVRLGEKGGAETVTLILNEMPGHSHSLHVNSGGGNSNNPSGNYLAADSEGVKHYSDVAASAANDQAIGSAGGSQSHENRQPFLTVNYCIALFGVYPSRS